MEGWRDGRGCSRTGSLPPKRAQPKDCSRTGLAQVDAGRRDAVGRGSTCHPPGRPPARRRARRPGLGGKQGAFRALPRWHAAWISWPGDKRATNASPIRNERGSPVSSLTKAALLAALLAPALALAEPAPAAPPPPPKWYDTVEFHGLVDTYYSVNLSQGQAESNSLRAFDAANGFQFAYAKVSASLAPTEKLPAGFRLDIGLGPVADLRRLQGRPAGLRHPGPAQGDHPRPRPLVHPDRRGGHRGQGQPPLLALPPLHPDPLHPHRRPPHRAARRRGAERPGGAHQRLGRPLHLDPGRRPQDRAGRPGLRRRPPPPPPRWPSPTARSPVTTRPRPPSTWCSAGPSATSPSTATSTT